MLAPDFFPTMLGNIGLIAIFAVIGAVLLYVGYFAIDLTTPGDLRGLRPREAASFERSPG